MTGFEQATLAAQHVALWIAAVDAAAVVIVAVGIWRGIREMKRDSEDLAVILNRHREADERRHEKVMAEIAARREANERRHEEAMKEIAARREADEKRREEAMNEGARRREEAMAGEGPAAAAKRP